MKKILILGGAQSQVPLIRAAVNERYYVVLCDFTTTNPGIKYANKHYQVSTLDRDAVLSVAKKECVDGVISNSEPAMQNVAYISQILGLRGNPLSAIEILDSKEKFRCIQEKCGLFSPKHLILHNDEEIIKKTQSISLPYIIKPTRSSGSRGTTIIYSENTDFVKKSFNECSAFSADNCVSIEEFIEMPSLHIIDGDVFVCEGEIIFDGLFLSTRSRKNPLVPMMQTYPLVISNEKRRLVYDAVKSIFKAAGIVFGEYNIEMYFTKNDELFVVEINSRQGGCNIPSMIFEHCGIDMNKLLVSTSVNDDSYFISLKHFDRKNAYVNRFYVFSDAFGTYEGLYISDEIKKYITNIEEIKHHGEKVEKCKNATSVIAYVNLKFDDIITQNEMCMDIEDKIYPIVI